MRTHLSARENIIFKVFLLIDTHLDYTMKIFIDTVENTRHNFQSRAAPSLLSGKDADCLNDDSYPDPTNNY